MSFPRKLLSSPAAQLALLAVVALAAGISLRWRQAHRTRAIPDAAGAEKPAILPRVLKREGAPFPKPSAPAAPPASREPFAKPAPVPSTAFRPPVLPLSLAAPQEAEPAAPQQAAPYGRLIPCETVLTIESNRLDTPVVGLVTQDLWQDGQLVVPAGAEVHGRASSDRSRDRLSAQGEWRIVWRTPGADNGSELRVQGLALDREQDPQSRTWGIHDGSAGLRGQVLRTGDWQQVERFAAAFLSSATLALQDTRTNATVLGETVTPAATVRNASLAGASAVLRDYATEIRDAIERDGTYVRVPAGTPFYLYITETIKRRSTHAN